MRIIHKQLLVLLCAATLGGGAYLHAQNDYPAPAKTPEEAGRMFLLILEEIKPNSGPFDVERAARYEGVLLREQNEAISSSRHGEEFLRLLSTQAHELQFNAEVSGKEGNATVVQVTPNASKGREVVVVPSDGGYRVDMKATYGRWNNLSGEQLDEAWWKYTGMMSPSLATNANFLRSQCQTNMKMQMLGVLQYSQDYDEKLPPARRWIDVVMPYVKSEQIFICPSLRSKGNGYAYNQNLSQLPQSKIDEVALTVNIYETSNPNRNVFAPFTGRAYRHQDGINLAFADGHIKWFRKDADLNALTIKP